MRKKYITSLNLVGPFDTIPNEQRKEWKKRYRGAMGRRMTDLALLVGEAIQTYMFTEQDVLIYATTYSELQSVEKFLDSFPSASPLHFQNAIHPAGLLQVLMSRQQPIESIIPLASKEHLVLDGLRTAMSSGAERVYNIVGEESATWLTEPGQSPRMSFAFAIELSSERSEHTIGAIEWQSTALEACHSSQDTIECLRLMAEVQQRKNIQICHPDYGSYHIVFDDF